MAVRGALRSAMLAMTLSVALAFSPAMMAPLGMRNPVRTRAMRSPASRFQAEACRGSGAATANPLRDRSHPAGRSTAMPRGLVTPCAQIRIDVCEYLSYN